MVTFCLDETRNRNEDLGISVADAHKISIAVLLIFLFLFWVNGFFFCDFKMNPTLTPNSSFLTPNSSFNICFLKKELLPLPRARVGDLAFYLLWQPN